MLVQLCGVYTKYHPSSPILGTVPALKNSTGNKKYCPRSRLNFYSRGLFAACTITTVAPQQLPVRADGNQCIMPSSGFGQSKGGGRRREKKKSNLEIFSETVFRKNSNGRDRTFVPAARLRRNNTSIELFGEQAQAHKHKQTKKQ